MTSALLSGTSSALGSAPATGSLYSIPPAQREGISIGLVNYVESSVAARASDYRHAATYRGGFEIVTDPAMSRALMRMARVQALNRKLQSEALKIRKGISTDAIPMMVLRAKLELARGTTLPAPSSDPGAPVLPGIDVGQLVKDSTDDQYEPRFPCARGCDKKHKRRHDASICCRPISFLCEQGCGKTHTQALNARECCLTFQCEKEGCSKTYSKAIRARECACGTGLYKCETCQKGYQNKDSATRCCSDNKCENCGKSYTRRFQATNCCKGFKCPNPKCNKIKTTPQQARECCKLFECQRCHKQFKKRESAKYHCMKVVCKVCKTEWNSPTPAYACCKGKK